MKKARGDEHEGVDLVKTTIRLKRSTWRAARIYAMDHGSDLQSVMGEALEAWLAQKAVEERRK